MKKLKYIIFICLLALATGSHFVNAQETSTASSVTEQTEEIREKVQEKIEEIQKNPKAYLGGVTDITESTIQIRNQEGVIQQVSINSETVYVKTTSKNAEVSFEDVAIGDFIVAMGYQESAEVLTASRILVTEKLVITNRKAVYGTVATIEKSIITLENKNEAESIEVEKNADILTLEDGENTDSSLSDIEEGDTIIAIGNLESNVLNARKIQITQKSEIEESTSEEE